MERRAQCRWLFCNDLPDQVAACVLAFAEGYASQWMAGPFPVGDRCVLERWLDER